MVGAALPCIVRRRGRTGEARVLCTGTAAVETICAVDRLPLAPGKDIAGIPDRAAVERLMGESG